MQLVLCNVIEVACMHTSLCPVGGHKRCQQWCSATSKVPFWWPSAVLAGRGTFLFNESGILFAQRDSYGHKHALGNHLILSSIYIYIYIYMLCFFCCYSFSGGLLCNAQLNFRWTARPVRTPRKKSRHMHIPAAIYPVQRHRFNYQLLAVRCSQFRAASSQSHCI